MSEPEVDIHYTDVPAGNCRPSLTFFAYISDTCSIIDLRTSQEVDQASVTESTQYSLALTQFWERLG